MKKRIRVSSFILAMILVLEAVVGQLAYGAGLGNTDRETKEQWMKNHVVESGCGIYRVDVKKVLEADRENYALLIAWRVKQGEKAGIVAAIDFADQLHAVAPETNVVYTEGKLVGHLTKHGATVMDLYLQNDRINFILTRAGEEEAKKAGGLYGTALVRNLTSKSNLENSILSFPVDGRERENTLSDLVDTVNKEDLLAADEPLVIDQQSKNIEDIERQSPSAAEQETAHEIELQSYSIKRSDVVKLSSPAYEGEEDEEYYIPPNRNNTPAERNDNSAEVSDDVYEAPIRERQAPVYPPRSSTSNNRVKEAKPVQPAIVISDAPGQDVAVMDKNANDSTIYELIKIVKHLDGNGQISEKETVVARYAMKDGFLVLDNLKNADYRLKEEGTENRYDFTVLRGSAIYNGQSSADNVLEITSADKKNSGNTNLLDKDKDGDHQPKATIKYIGNGLSKVEIQLVDEKGHTIDGEGAVYDLYRVAQGAEEKVQTVRFESEKTAADIENEKNESKPFSGLQANEKKEEQTTAPTKEESTTTDSLNKENGVGDKPEKTTPLATDKTETRPEEIHDQATVENEKPTVQVELSEGVYALREVEPPKGYDKTEGTIELSVTRRSDPKDFAAMMDKSDAKSFALGSFQGAETNSVEEYIPGFDANALTAALEETGDAPLDPNVEYAVEAKAKTDEEKLDAKVIKDVAATDPAQVQIVYRAMADSPTGTLKILTKDKDGNKLFYGGTSSAEIGNLRDAALNHDATYAVYKYDETDKTYKPLNLYDKMVYDAKQKKEVAEQDAEGNPVKVNYKNGKFGAVTLDKLPPGKYVVKEVKSVFQYAFKNLAMTFTVGEDGTISNYKDATVDLADYEKDQTKPSTGEVARKKLTYNEKMKLDSERTIHGSEVKEKENPNLKESTQPGTGKTIEATYHKGNLRVKKVDKDGKPIEGVTLELHGHDANRILRIYRVTTDANGIAEFKDLNVPSYHLLKEVAAPKNYSLPNHQWMIYFGEGTWVEFDKNHKPKTEHIPLQISDNQVYATKVQLKPIIKLNPQETRQVVENDKYRPLIDGVTGASIAPKNWFQFLGINNPAGAPKEGTPEAEQYWSTNWNNVDYFKDGTYEKSFNKSKDELFYNTREGLTPADDDPNIYNFSVKNYPRAKVTVNKKDEKGNILPGATFAIYKVNEDGSQTPAKKGLNDWTEVSGLDGKAIFDNLPEGNYVIKEIKTPGGYRQDDRSYAVSVNGNGQITLSGTNGLKQSYVDQIFSQTATKYIVNYRNYSIQFNVASKIVDINKDNKTFTQLVYIRPAYEGYPNNGLSYDTIAGDMTLRVTPYIEEAGVANAGQANSAGQNYTNYEIFAINEPNPSIPAGLNVNLADSQFTSKGAYNTSGTSLTFHPANDAGKYFSGDYGHIIKLTGTYKGDKPIFAQATLFSPKYYANEEQARVRCVTGAKLDQGNPSAPVQSELSLDVTNTRNEDEPLDKKGTINISKLISETDTLLKDAEFGLYKNTWDKIGPRDKPFATLKTGDSQIGNLTVADKKVNLQFKDIPPGVYTLKELNAPVGYEKTLYTWTVRVFPSGVTLVNLNPNFEKDPTLEEPVNVNDKVHVDRNSFKFYINREEGDTRDKHIFYANKNEFFKTEFAATLDKGIKRGNYFTIDLDKKLSYGGTIVEDIIPDITLGDTGYVLATGKLDPATNQIKYTFTEIAENLNTTDLKFAFTLLTERNQIKYDGSHSFNIKIANETFTTDQFSINHSLFINNILWLNDDHGNTRISAFMNSISYERAEVEMAFYVVPTNTTTTTSRKLDVEIKDGIIPPIEKSRYEIYEVLNPGTETNPNVPNQTYYRDMPASFGIDYSDTTKYKKVQDGYIQRQYQTIGTIPINNENINKYLIARVISPFKVTDVQTQDEATIRIESITTDSQYGANYPATREITSSISIKPSEVFSQSSLTEGEVLAFNRKKDPMKFTLWKKNMDNEVIKDGTVQFKMEVAEDYPDSTPVPDSWKDISLDLSKQTDKEDPTKSVPMEIEIPAGMTGEYNLIETAAPKGYVVNGMRYRIKVDSSARTVQLISVKDSAGNPVEYKFKLQGTGAETLLTATNPALLYREQTDADGKITADTRIVALDISDPVGEFPHAGGFGPRWIVIIGAIIAAIAAEEYIRRKRTSAPKGGA